MRPEWRQYITGLKQRDKDAKLALSSRRELAMLNAKQASDILRTKFGATKVVVFGSVTRDDFSATSDVDIAAWGIPENATFKAMHAVACVSKQIEMNLVDMHYARDYMIAEIANTGVEI